MAVCRSLLRIRKLAPSTGAKLVQGRRMVNRFPRHAHESLVIGLVDKGVRVFATPTGCRLAAKGCLFVIPPSAPHTCWSPQNRPHDYRVLAAPPWLLKQTSRNADGMFTASGQNIEVYGPESRAAKRFSRLWKALSQRPNSCEGLDRIQEFTAELPIGKGPAPRLEFQNSPKVCRLLESRLLIEAELPEKLSLEVLGRRTGMSRCRFQKEFLALFGVTPQEHRLNTRIKRAAGLLLSGRAVSEVAQAVGFFDQSHFTHAFKKSMGVTPGSFFRSNTC